MNNINGKNTYLSKFHLNIKRSKQEQRQNNGHGECIDGCQIGGGMGEWVKR